MVYRKTSLSMMASRFAIPRIVYTRTYKSHLRNNYPRKCAKLKNHMRFMVLCTWVDLIANFLEGPCSHYYTLIVMLYMVERQRRHPQLPKMHFIQFIFLCVETI